MSTASGLGRWPGTAAARRARSRRVTTMAPVASRKVEDVRPVAPPAMSDAAWPGECRFRRSAGAGARGADGDAMAETMKLRVRKACKRTLGPLRRGRSRDSGAGGKACGLHDRRSRIRLFAPLPEPAGFAMSCNPSGGMCRVAGWSAGHRFTIGARPALACQCSIEIAISQPVTERRWCCLPIPSTAISSLKPVPRCVFRGPDMTCSARSRPRRLPLRPDISVCRYGRRGVPRPNGWSRRLSTVRSGVRLSGWSRLTKAS